MQSVETVLVRNLPAFLIILDPEKCSSEEQIKNAAGKINKIRPDAVLIGGSSNLNADSIWGLFKELKTMINKPLISFLRDASEITTLADACFVPMIMNSRKPWFLFDNFLNCLDNAQEAGIEQITLAYLVQPGETSVSFLVDPHPVPIKEGVLRKYAHFANFLNFNLAYLEGGSGAETTFSSNLVQKFKSYLRIPLFVGGGIKNFGEAKELLAAGADGLVVGTLFEKEKIDLIEKIASLVRKQRNEDN